MRGRRSRTSRSSSAPSAGPMIGRYSFFAAASMSLRTASAWCMDITSRPYGPSAEDLLHVIEVERLVEICEHLRAGETDVFLRLFAPPVDLVEGLHEKADLHLA